MTSALCQHIGRICHVYLDDIIIWSSSVAEHVQNVTLVLQALHVATLFCSPKKMSLFCDEINFLGHTILACGVKANASKCEKIHAWPTPRSASDVCAFLGLVQYIAAFLPRLADHTRHLSALTSSDCDKVWPSWSKTHAAAFQAIKDLVLS